MKRSRRSSRVLRGTGVLLAGLLALTGCSFDVGELVGDKISEFSGGELDVTLGAGPTCMPDWVTYPEGEDSANQGWASSDAEVCVSSWFVPRSTDIAQSLPYMADGDELAEIFGMLLPLLSSQLPGGIGNILLGGGGLDELTDKLKADNAEFTAYGTEGFILLVLTADGSSDDEMQVVMGVFCQGSC